MIQNTKLKASQFTAFFFLSLWHPYPLDVTCHFVHENLWTTMASKYARHFAEDQPPSKVALALGHSKNANTWPLQKHFGFKSYNCRNKWIILISTSEWTVGFGRRSRRGDTCNKIPINGKGKVGVAEIFSDKTLATQLTRKFPYLLEFMFRVAKVEALVHYMVPDVTRDQPLNLHRWKQLHIRIRAFPVA